eukprot:4545207-Lingulodinium_polyedra.AAC.1
MGLRLDEPAPQWQTGGPAGTPRTANVEQLGGPAARNALPTPRINYGNRRPSKRKWQRAAWQQPWPRCPRTAKPA